jgi:hypothetical protein
MEPPSDAEKTAGTPIQFSLASALVITPLAAGLVYLHLNPSTFYPLSVYFMDAGFLLVLSVVLSSSLLCRSKNPTTIFFCVIWCIGFLLGLLYWLMCALERSRV